MNVKSELKLVFTGLVTQYPGIGKLFDSYWKEIVDAYGAAYRHYHNLQHLFYIHTKLIESPQQAVDREALLFALFYHDIMYNIGARDNEQRSADIAVLRMEGVGAPKDSANRCVNHILATATHKFTGIPDTDLFCDADIAILGESPVLFAEYCRKVRKEYLALDEQSYRAGRRDELQKLLEREHLFHTDHFRKKYEGPARNNLEKEIKNLAGH